MEQAIPVMLMLGAVVVALLLILIGIFAWGRSRQAPAEAVNSPASALIPSTDPEAPRPSSPEPVYLYLEDDGTFAVEIAGRRFARLSDILDDRLAQRAMAAVSAMQKFAGITPEARLAPAELNDELRAGYARDDGTFVVEFRGQRYRKLTDIRDGDIGRGVLSMIGKLEAFAQGVAVPVPVPPKPGEPQGVTEDEFLKQLAAPPVEPKPLRMPTLVESAQARPVKAEPMPMGIAGQIDQVLQQQLVNNPSLLGRSIHLVTAKDGSLGVEVEGRLYKWPDEVEPVVREAVQKAIRAWESTAL